jgi:hypothetical protein
MRRALITTTINAPHVLRKWRESGLTDDDVIIVSGDRKTPHDEVRDILAEMSGTNVYLAPEDQTKWESSTAIGWNCIQRRNIALLEALTYSPDYIITVDDDNYPASPDFIKQLDDAFAGDTFTDIVTSDTGWYNPGRLLSPEVTVRGYPLSQRHVKNTPRAKLLSDEKIGVVASLWLGEPDIDAVERIVCAPNVTAMRSNANVALAHGTWSPFNTQSTAYRTIFAPFMMVWPHVGRYDDIWASFLTQRAMETSGYHVSFGRPLVRQDRNPHNLVTDVENELFGMKYNEEVIDLIRDLPTYGQINSLHDALDVLNTWYDSLVTVSWLPERTSYAFDAWCNDITDVVERLR